MKLLSALTSLVLTAHVASAASIIFDGRTNVADNTTYNLTSIGGVDWAVWNTADNPATGAATNDMSGGFGIGSISAVGTGSIVRGSTSGVTTDFSFSNGTTSTMGTATNVSGLFNSTLVTAGEGVQLGFTLANSGQEYTINVWTGAFASASGVVVGSISGATSYNSGSAGGTGAGSTYGDNLQPKEPYLYTFRVTADNPNDVFNFSVVTAGGQLSSSHVLIAAAAISTAIPEPGTYALLAGVCMLGFVTVRRRARR